MPNTRNTPDIAITSSAGTQSSPGRSRAGRSKTTTGNPPPLPGSGSLRVATEMSPPSFSRSKSLTTGISLASTGGGASGGTNSFNPAYDAPPLTASSSATQKRGRSSSILSIHEIKDNYDDDLDQSALTNLNADWVNYKGAWLIHVVLIVIGKVLVDSIPGIEQDTSWTIVLQGYLLATYVMFHFVEGVPFESNSGVYDRLTMWEQIDGGAQYTPAKKWLTSLPILLFLLSTHYTRYDRHPALFSLNLISLIGLALIPKLPQLHRQRVTFGPGKDHGGGEHSTGANTPVETAMSRATLPPLPE